jgi:phage terminase small subunit
MKTKKALRARGILPMAGGQLGSKAALQVAEGKTTNGKVIRKADSLTPKQEAFAVAVALGSTLVDAYRSSYDIGEAKLSTIYDSASKLMDRPLVAQRIKTILEDRYSRSLIHNVKHVRQHVFDRLMIESMNEKSQASARIRAVELLGKVDVVAMFRENIEAKPSDQRKPDDIEQEIRTRLAALLGGKTIDN